MKYQGKITDPKDLVTKEYVDTGLSGKLGTSGDGSNVTAAFTAASSRTNISTGEKLSVIFGKIAKWLADLGAAAFRNVDSAPTANSMNLVESGGVKSAITKVETDLASLHATGPTNTTGAAIATGTYFYLAPQSGDDEILVQAKANIAVNATFTSGTNYETVTAGGLNELKSALNNVVYRDWINMGINTTKDFSIPYTNRVYLITWACAYSPGTGAWLLFNGDQQQEVVKLSTNSYANLAVLNATTIRLSYSYTQGVSNGNFSIILI